MHNTIILSSAMAIMLIGMLGSAVILLDEERMKRLVIAQAEASTGRKVEILGSLRVRLFPGLRLRAESVVFRSPHQPDAPVLFEAERLDMSLRLLPLIRGQARSNEIRLSGARLNLQGDAAGVRGLTDESERPAARPASELASAPIRVDDLVIQVSDASDQVRQVFELDQVQLSGFAFDHPVAFRFSGNFGDPPLFDRVEIDGRMISSADGQVRLEPMRLLGSLEQERYRLELNGNLSLKGGSQAQLRLDDARLKLNQHEFRLELLWQALERPGIMAELSADQVDVDVLAVLDQLAAWVGDPARRAAVAAVDAMDIDLALSVGRVARAGLVLDDLSVGLSAIDGLIRIRSLQAAVPGGLLLASAELDLRSTDPRWLAELEVEIAQARRLAASLRQDFGLGGAGRLQMQLESSGMPGQLPWQGHGQLQLWDGRWEWLSWLKTQAVIEPADAHFAGLESTLVLGPRQLQWSSLELVGTRWQAQGTLDLSLPESELQGQLRLGDGQGMDRVLELAGSFQQPELLAPPLLVPASQ